MHPDSASPQTLFPQTLLIDADDTLWENNIYFERAIASFIAYLKHPQHSAARVRSVLNECEHATIAAHGYGMVSFERSLIDCFTKLSQTPPTEEQRLSIAGFARTIAEQAIELLPGVAETLPLLAKRNRLILVTKGNAREQQKKLDRSGIHMHFTAVEIPPEKHPDAYHDILTRHALSPTTTWMIGNSPRSDINPAIAAGLHAVYVHHPNTWVLEHDDLVDPVPPQQLLQLDSFAALATHF